MRQSVVHSFAHSFIDSVNRKPWISGPWMQKTLSLPFRSQSIQGDEHVRSQLKYRTISYHEERHLPSSCGIPEAKVLEATSQGVGFWVNTWSRRVTRIRGPGWGGQQAWEVLRHRRPSTVGCSCFKVSNADCNFKPNTLSNDIIKACSLRIDLIVQYCKMVRIITVICIHK